MGQSRSIRPVRNPALRLRAVRSQREWRQRAEVSGLADRLLADITHLLVSESSPDRVLEAVAEALRQIVPYDTLTLYQADLRLRVLRPVLVLDRWAAEILAMGPLRFGQGITGRAAEAGEPQLVNDVMADPRAVQIDGTPREPEALIVVPLLAPGELKGTLCLYRLGEGNTFTDDEFRLAIRFGEVAALAIDNAQIRARLEAEVVTDHLTGLYNHRYFHERLAQGLREATLRRSTMALVVYDLDDFSRVNASFGHVVGDQVLQGVAAASREVCRDEDVVCRVGGEEFAVIMPETRIDDAAAFAERLRAAVSAVETAEAASVTVSVGIAEGPTHATAARDLMACADATLREAKANGKDRVEIWSHVPSTLGRGHAAVPSAGGDGRLAVTHARPADLALGDEVRSVAHLKMLQSLSAKLNRLNDVARIGEAITAELRSLIDYHNCRVHLLQPDGETLLPVAFRGELLEYEGETVDALVTKVGEGITGRVAATGRSLYIPNAVECEFSVLLPGTNDVDESMLCVPLKYGDRVTGIVTLSKLGIDQFDHDDLRMLEVLSSHAAVAFENARLFELERESADVSRSLLRLSQRLTRVREMDAVLAEALEAIPALIDCASVEAWIGEGDGAGFRLRAHRGYEPIVSDRLAKLASAEVAEPYVALVDEPHVVPKEVVRALPDKYRAFENARDVLVAPMRWDPDRLGIITVTASSPERTFPSRDLALAKGIADIASLALGNAERFAELERAYVSTIEALANALEAKDEYTGDHARALAELALAVGAGMGMVGDGLKRLEIAALFHDIGKIGVPSEIIRKPGRLTAEERRIMNLHPEIGEKILEPVPFLQPIRPIIRACHERWDGEGYPDGLVGTAIPVEARIILACDAFHAMTTTRPYRKALAEGEAVRRMKLAAGTQFDPEVVGVFVRLHATGKIHLH